MSEFAQALNPAAEFEYNARVRELFADLEHAGSFTVGAVREPPSLTSTEGGSWVNHSRWSRTAPTQIGTVFSATGGSREQGFSIQLYVEVHDAHIQTVRYQA